MKSAVLLILATVTAAPIPPAKSRPPMNFAGNWKMFWSGSEWPATLYPSGEYIAEREGGPRYTGTWKYADEKFVITERLDNYPTAYTYTFKMSGGRLISDCGGLRFERRK